MKNDWPTSIMKSRGKCEVCGQPASCHYVPSRSLPARHEPLVQEARKAITRRDINTLPQRLRAEDLLREIRERRVVALRVPLKQLDALLDEARNTPPEGAADGSIKPAQFARLRAVVTAGDALLKALADYTSNTPTPPPEDPF